MSSGDHSPGWRSEAPRTLWMPAFGVAAVALLVYVNSLGNGFAFDDVWIIERNLRVHDLRALADIWLTPYWPTFGEDLGLYRPLAIFGYALQWALSGGQPWLFHLTNVALHAAVSVLVFLFLTRFASIAAAAAGGILFAVHPVHTEVVANGVGQAELIAAAATMAACWIFAGPDPSARLRPLRLAAIAGLYAAAMLAKESAIVLPGLLIAIDVAQRRLRFSRDGLRRYLDAMALPIVVLGAAAVLYLALRVDVLGSVGGEDAAPTLPFLHEQFRRVNALRAWPEYARLLFMPWDLAADYSPAVILPVTQLTPMVLFGAALLLLTLALAASLPLRPAAGFPAAWFLIAILPVSNLVVPAGILVAERTLYLPSVAISMAAAFACDALRRPERRRALRLAAVSFATITLVFAFRTVTRNPEWRSTETILEALLRDRPESYRGHWYAAAQAISRGDTAASQPHWELAVRLWPRDPQLLSEFGIFLVQRGRFQQAINVLEASLQLKPDLFRTHEAAAIAYIGAGRFEDGLRSADQAIRLAGPVPNLLAVRARALAGLGRHREAVAAWNAALRRSPARSWLEWALVAQSSAATGDLEGARAALDSATSRAAGDSTALRQLAEARRAFNIDP